MIARLLGYLLLMVLVSAGAVFFGYLSFYQPKLEEIEKIANERRDLQAKKEKGQKVRREIQDLESLNKKTKQEIVTLLKTKTKDRDVNKFLNDIELHAQDSGTTLKSIRINPKTQMQLYTEIMMDFNIEGSYFQVYDFLTRLERDGFLNFSKSNINISGGGVDRGYKVKDLKEQTAKRTDLKDINGKGVKLKELDDSTEFPRLRIVVDGRLIIIDSSHITRYE